MSGTPTQSRRPLSRGTSSSSSAPFVSRESPSAPSRMDSHCRLTWTLTSWSGNLAEKPFHVSILIIKPFQTPLGLDYQRVVSAKVFWELFTLVCYRKVGRHMQRFLHVTGTSGFGNLRKSTIGIQDWLGEWRSHLIDTPLDTTAVESVSGKKCGRLGPPKNVSLTVLEELIVHWGKPETKAQSETNSKNKRSDRGGKGAYVHNLGSTSLLSRERELRTRVTPLMLSLYWSLLTPTNRLGKFRIRL